MKTTIFTLLKFFKEEQHARAFVAGRLHLNPLAYFKGLDQSEDDGRADRHEAPIGWHQPTSLGHIQVGSVRIEPTDLAGPVIVQRTDADFRNVLCMYAMTPGPFEQVSTANLEALRKHLHVPDRCRSMGALVVVILRSRVFMERFDEATRRNRFGLQRGLVTYFDPDSLSGIVERPLFMKRQEFAWQREYRFALDRNASEPEPYTFDIGPLSDLCTVVDAAVLNDAFKVTLPA